MKIAHCKIVGTWVCRRQRNLVQLATRRVKDGQYAVGVHLDMSYCISGETLPTGWVMTRYADYTCHFLKFSDAQDNYPLIHEACQLGGMFSDSGTVWNPSLEYILHACGVQLSTMYMPVAHVPVVLPEQLSFEEAQRRLREALKRLEALSENILKPLTAYSRVWDEVQYLSSMLSGVEDDPDKIIN